MKHTFFFNLDSFNAKFSGDFRDCFVEMHIRNILLVDGTGYLKVVCPRLHAVYRNQGLIHRGQNNMEKDMLLKQKGGQDECPGRHCRR